MKGTGKIRETLVEVKFTLLDSAEGTVIKDL